MLNVVFASSRYDLEALGFHLRERLAGPVIGCTTAGEIGPGGFASGTASGFSLAAPDFEAHPYLITPLRTLDPTRISAILKCAHHAASESKGHPLSRNAFGFLLVDGFSRMEEPVAAVLGSGLSPVPLAGCSAGDALHPKASPILFNGRVVEDAAAFVLVLTTHPCEVFKTQHFTASEDRLVVTRATPERRLVQELDGYPAVEAYARRIGVAQENLVPELCAKYPFLLRFGGDYYVRSVLGLGSEGSLALSSAVEEGVVLRVGQGGELAGGLEASLSRIRARIGQPQLTIGCDSNLRRLEIVTRGQEDRVNRALRDAAVIGLSCHGQQFGAMHVNQSFAGIAIGVAP